MDDERKGSPWIAWCSGIIVLLGLYAGAYAWCADAYFLVESDGASGQVTTVEPEYRVLPNGFALRFFWPIHQIDRKVRPQVWDFRRRMEPYL